MNRENGQRTFLSRMVPQMLLLPDCVCLGNEIAKLLALVVWSFESEVVDMVGTRNRINAVKERRLVAVRQDQVPYNS